MAFSSGSSARLSTKSNLEAEVTYSGWTYHRILACGCRWSVWAGPDKGLTGDAREFVGRVSDLIDQATTESLGERIQVRGHPY